MKISYAILTHNEDHELDALLSKLFLGKDTEDEIVVVDDFSDNLKTLEIIKHYPVTVFEQRKLNGNFSEQKNFLDSLCSGDYIVNIDADEYLHDNLLENMKVLLDANSGVDLIWVPRINTVDGITQDHIHQWGWSINENGWVNFPDYQSRIYRNDPSIHWTKKVHERIVGHKTQSHIPPVEEWSIYHHKSIDRQESQNSLYFDMIVA